MNYGVKYISKTFESKQQYSIFDVAKWHAETFPDVTIEDQKKKFNEESKEWDTSLDMLELADMYIVACGMSRFCTLDSCIAFHKISDICQLYHIPSKELLRAVDAKMNTNKQRSWKRLQSGAYKHIA